MKHFLFNSKAKNIPKNHKYMIDVNTIEDGKYNNVHHIRLFGGDGTINKFINKHDVRMITLHKYGSGNDLYRAFKKSVNTFTYNVNDLKFINGFGYGIDSHVCEVIENQANKAYFSSLIKSVINFKRFDLKLNIDDHFYSFNNCHTICIFNGQFFGGGIKIAPKAKLENEELDVVIFHELFGIKMFVAILLVLIKKHYLLKNNVFYTKANRICIFNDKTITYQIDGELITTSSNINISLNKPIKVKKSKKRF